MRLALLSLLVHDYDDAIAYYRDKLDFSLVEDTTLTPHKRWVVVRPPDERDAAEAQRDPPGADILLAKAKNDEERARVGDQTGGRVFLFLHTANFDARYRTMLERGVDFVEKPRLEPFGKVVVFRDLYGTKWDLVERAGSTAGATDG